MLKRFELHNHSTHSDAVITCLELAKHMEKDQVDVLALTDHNTISGHFEMKEILRKHDFHVQAVYGMEITTYYGHILCLNLPCYISWESIDICNPEKIFKACKKAGAISGIAHPFSYGSPFARGCRFEMKVHDFSDIDFIEIFNNPEPLQEVNAPGLKWWEDLCLKGEKLAATAGMDMHDLQDMSMMFSTYLEGEKNGNPEEELDKAIHSLQTWVSKGIILRYKRKQGQWCFWLEETDKPGFKTGNKWLLILRDVREERIYEMTDTGILLSEDAIPKGPVMIIKLFQDSPRLENLVCVSPVMYR